jgi:hypothetical protein
VANELTDLIRKINSAARSDRNLRSSLITTLAVHKDRIFKNGADAGNGKIGTYSTRPTSISKKQQARNTGQTFFPGGYSEYKRAIGKNPGYVNWRNTDQMMMDYGLVGSNGSYGFGFNNPENYKKFKNLEKKANKNVGDLSSREFDVLADVTVKLFLKSI